MKKLSEIFKKLLEKFKSFSKTIKIAIVIAVVTLLIAIISVMIFSMSDKYEVLFNNLDAADAETIVSTLEDNKATYKVQGDSILVLSTEVDKLRMELAPNLSSASKGYELMDDSSSFGMTDEEFKIKQVRMIQGELEKGIKTIAQIESCKVMINQATDSVFVKNKTEGSASVILELKSGAKLSNDQVAAIVSYVSVSTDNIPKKNIAVLDTGSNLLSKNLKFDDDSENGESVTGSSSTSEAVTDHYEKEAKYEEKLSEKVISLLEPVVGSGKVQAEVNVDFNFDSQKVSEYEIDPNKVLISQETENSYNNTNGDSTTSSPVDDNMSNNIDESTGNNNSSSEHQINNWDYGKKTTETVKAPGEVRRMTVSVFIDGVLDDTTQTAFENAIKAATGFNSERLDDISVVGIQFDPTAKDEANALVEDYNKALESEKTRNLIIAGIIGLIILVGIIVLTTTLRKKNKKEDIENISGKEEALLDVVIDDELEPTQNFKPIDFEVPQNEDSHVEEEIKNYAKDKPEQVVDIIKSWLNENER